MVDCQVITLEESPDSLEDGGSQPKRMTVFLKEDLTDPTMSKRISPGNKVKVIGTLKEIEISGNGGKPLIRYDLAIEANNIIPLENDIEELEITEEEEREILEISKRGDLVEYLGKSVAPSVCGHEDIKKALVLQLFGGVSRQRSDGSYCREQIHGLLVGDPGVAKSVILKYLQEISHKSRYVSGKSASGVGLTATVSRDEITKAYVLEAGAMVLANNGYLFIDEFEKMSDEDRSNLHEGMSIGTISVSKATVQATLNSKTSVLAAANPKFGRFDVEKPFASQINLQPSLLSRFDFIFVMRDVAEEKRDNMIADKIFSEHSEETEYDVLEKDMFKKYIAFAKKFKPKMGEAAVKILKDYYINLRKKAKSVDGKKIIPIGARQLEGLIRFSEASAKIRLSNQVTIADAKQAISIMETYLKEVGYDEENGTFDIDKISGCGASQRNKVDVVKKIIIDLSKAVGKTVSVDKIKTELDETISSDDIDETLDKIVRAGDAFRPKRGYIQLM
jgi:replicative DNA helicase Mcm